MKEFEEFKKQTIISLTKAARYGKEEYTNGVSLGNYNLQSYIDVDCHGVASVIGYRAYDIRSGICMSACAVQMCIEDFCLEVYDTLTEWAVEQQGFIA